MSPELGVGSPKLVEIPGLKSGVLIDTEAIELARRFMDIHRRNWPECEGACEVRALDGEESRRQLA